MAKKFAAIIILCEDLMHGNFVRHYLLQKGVPPNKIIRINNCPAGKQSGAQYVLQNYPKEVSALRSTHYISQGLIAVIDADTFTGEERIANCRKALLDAGLENKTDAESISVIVPRRNVETWIYHLLGNVVNETDKYDNRVEHANVKPVAQEFASRCPGSLKADCPPSMNTGCAELTKFIAKIAG